MPAAQLDSAPGGKFDHLRPDTADAVAELAALPDVIRGYEDIKLQSVSAFREKAAAALADLAT